MDFFGFGYLKQRIFNKRATRLAGFWKIWNDEWKKITPETCTKVYAAWKRRLRMVAKLDGEHKKHSPTQIEGAVLKNVRVFIICYRSLYVYR